MTTEYARLRHAVLAILNYPGECSRLRSAVGSILYDQLTDALASPPSPPVAPEPAQENQQPPDEQRGFYLKYRVERLNDHAGKHRDCLYFVLDERHDKFAGPALRAYAKACEAEFPQLAADLRERHGLPAEHVCCTGLGRTYCDCECHGENQVSSGEAAGDGVSDRAGDSRALLLRMRKRAGGSGLSTDDGLNIADALESALNRQEQAEREAGWRYDNMRNQRDAERAQKEALRELLSRVHMWRGSGLPSGLWKDIATVLNGAASAQQPTEAAPVLSREEALDAMGEEVERHPLGAHGGAAPVAKLECPRNCEGGSHPDPRNHAVNCPKSEPVAKAVVAAFVADREEQLSEVYDAPLRRDARRAQAANMAALQAIEAAAGATIAKGDDEPGSWTKPVTAGQAKREFDEAVAKEEAPSEPIDLGGGMKLYPATDPAYRLAPETVEALKVAPSEPVAWAPHAFQVVRVKGLKLRRGEEGTVVGRDPADCKVALHMHRDGATAHYQLSDLEPAPQPPATAGEDRPVMLGELVVALRHGARCVPESSNAATALRAACDELERRTK